VKSIGIERRTSAGEYLKRFIDRYFSFLIEAEPHKERKKSKMCHL